MKKKITLLFTFMSAIIYSQGKIDMSSTFKAQSMLQNNYNNNTQIVQNTINNIYKEINNLDISESERTLIIETFSNNIAKNLNSRSFNYASASQTNQIINWLYDSANKIVQNVTTKSKQSNSNNSDYLSEYYGKVFRVWRIAIYNNGDKAGKDDPIRTDSTIYLKPDEISFKKADGTSAYRNLTNKRYNGQKGGYEYSSDWGAVFIDQNLKYVEFFADSSPSGSNYTYFISSN